MSALVLGAVALLCTVGRPAPALSLAAGPPRAFGGREVSRTFRLEGEGEYNVVWRTRIFRGIVERGEQTVMAPKEFKIALRLPRVRARVELIQEVQLKREEEAVTAGGAFPLALFPATIFSDFAKSHAVLPPIGVYDPRETITPFFKEAGLKFVHLRSDLQAQYLESKLVVIGPGWRGTMGEPMGGVFDLLENGGTAIFLEPAEMPRAVFPREESGIEILSGTTAATEAVVGRGHIILQDMLPEDLRNWGGSGRVASTLFGRPDWPRFRPLLVGSVEGKRFPLAAEYCGSGGRVILCQIEIARHLADEPAAQMLLRNLLAYARETAVPAPVRTVMMAIPPEAVRTGKFETAQFVLDPDEEALQSAAGILTLVMGEKEQPPEPGFDLAAFLKDDGRVVIRSTFGDELLRAVNHLLGSTWRADVKSPLPRIRAVEPPGEWRPVVDYEIPLAWGVLPEDVAAGLAGVEDARFLEVERQVPAWRVLVEPGIVAKFQRKNSLLILCAFPPPEPETERDEIGRVVAQIAANMSFKPGNGIGKTVQGYR